MRKRITYTLLLLMGAVMLAGCKQKAADTGAEIPLLEPVGTNAETEPVMVRDLYDIVTKDAEYTPYTAELCFEEGGTIENIFVRLGERVQEGDLLAEMSEWAYTNAESQASNRYWNEKNNADNQIAEYEELKKESKTQEEKDWYDLLIRQTQEAFEMREPELKKIWDAAKARLGRNTIMAPFDGVVTAVRSNGDRLSTGQAAVAISDLSRGYVAVDGYLSPEEYAKYSEIYAIIGGVKTKLIYDPEVQNEDKSYTLFSLGEDREIAYGDFVLVCYVKNLHENVLSLPSSAVTRENGKVYVLLQDGEKWVRTDVTTGYSNNYYVEIIDGLKEGDRVYAKK